MKIVFQIKKISQLLRKVLLYNKEGISSFLIMSNTSRRWCTLGIAASFFFYQYILRVLPGIIANDLMGELSITAYSLGIIISFYYYGYTLMQIPAGLILDRFELRLPLIFTSLICTLGIFIFVVSENVVFLCFGRLLIGIGSAFGLLSCIKAATLFFPSQWLRMIIGISIMLGNIGGASVGGPVAKLVCSIGWRQTFVIFGIIGCIISFLSFAFIHRFRSFQKNPLNSASNFTAIKFIFKDVQVLFKNPQTWIFGFYGFLMQMSLSSFSELWGVPYLSHLYKIESSLASSVLSFLFLGMTVGGPLVAWLAGIFQSYRILMRVGAFLTAIQFSLLVYVPTPFYLMHFLLFFSGILMCTQVLAFACICELNSPKISGVASGVHNMICMVSGIVSQPLIGLLLDLQWGGYLKEGVPYYSANNYYLALSVLPIGLTLAYILTFLMRETYLKVEKKQDTFRGEASLLC